MVKLIVTVFYVGLLRPAPGTWGSVVSIPLAWLVVLLGGWPLLAAGCVAALFGGWWATGKYTAGSENEDPSEVVIDELAGQWVALLPIAIATAHTGVSFWALWPGVLTAFAAFRLFDIWKPGPVGWADRRGDPLGVMLDDVIAGVFAAAVVMIGAAAAHGF